jgi:hypothetical protein
MTRILHWWVGLNIVIIVVVGLVIGYWYFIDGVLNPVLLDKTDVMALKTDRGVYAPGDSIVVYNAFCKLRPIIGTSAVQIVDGQVLQMRATEVNLPVGCYGVDKPFSGTATALPRNIGKGYWHLEWTIVYHVNPIKDVTYHRRSVDFRIE